MLLAWLMRINNLLIISFTLLMGCSKYEPSNTNNLSSNYTEGSFMSDVDIEMKKDGQVYILHANKLVINQEEIK